MALDRMTRFARSFRSFKDKVRGARTANEWTRLMFAPDTAPMDYSNYDLDRKRAAPIRDENRISEAQVNEAIRDFSATRDDLVLRSICRGMIDYPGGRTLRY